MGFRLIKNNPKQGKDQRIFLRKKELAKEARRWVNLAGHTARDFDAFLTHFEEVLDKSKEAGRGAVSAGSLSQKIRGTHTRLEYVQGNLSLSHIDELLNGYSPTDTSA